MLCGLRDCTNQAALYWELPDGLGGQAPEYRIVPELEPDA
jgi:hypothetical protein